MNQIQSSSGGCDVLVMAQGEAGCVRLLVQPGSIEVVVHAAGFLPLSDRSVRRFLLDEAMGRLPVRERLQVLLECRRCLEPGGSLLPARPSSADRGEGLSRWAALAGLSEAGDLGVPWAWRKEPDIASASPLVSIVIPAWNPRYFAECLDSAMGQTYPNTEIIVGDDSPGPEIESLASSRQQGGRIRYVRNSPRLGARRNYEALLQAARGEYVKFLNDDDVLSPDCVARLLQPFLVAPGLAISTSHRQRIDEQSRPLADIPATMPVVPHDVTVNGVSLANAMIMFGLNFIGEPSTMMLRKRHFATRPEFGAPDIFHFNGEKVAGAVDMAMASRALLQGDAAFLSARLSRFRVHPEQAQANPEIVNQSIKGIRALQQQWITLGLFRRFHPGYLEVRRLGGPAEAGRRWSAQRLLWVQPSGDTPENEVRRWRETRSHPFDTEVR